MRSIIILNKSTFGLLAKAGNYIDLWTWSRYNLLLFYFPKTKRHCISLYNALLQNMVPLKNPYFKPLFGVLLLQKWHIFMSSVTSDFYFPKQKGLENQSFYTTNTVSYHYSTFIPAKSISKSSYIPAFTLSEKEYSS